MAFWGKFPVRSKIVLEGTVLEQVSDFNYLGCTISIGNDTGRDITTKISRFQMMCGVIHRTLRTKTRKDIRLKFHRTMAVPVSVYVFET